MGLNLNIYILYIYIVPVTSMSELEDKLPEITGSRSGPRIGYGMGIE